MKSYVACFFTITIILQPITALAVDYSDFDSYCQTLRQSELEFLEKEVEDGLLTEEEAEEELDYVLKVAQCVCYFQKVLEGTSADFTLYLQKDLEAEAASDIPLTVELQKFAEDPDYYKEEIEKHEMLKLMYPEGLDIEAFLIDSEKACGLDPE